MPDTTIAAGRLLRLPPARLRLHPACEFVPEMRPQEWAEFLADVARRGIAEPLTVILDPDRCAEFRIANGEEGYLIVDGRHRFKAAKIHGDLEDLPCRVIKLDPDQVAGYVLAAALHRRHLTDDNRAMLAEKYRRQLAEKSKEKSAATARDGKLVASGVDATKNTNPDKDLRSENAAASKPHANSTTAKSSGAAAGRQGRRSAGGATANESTAPAAEKRDRASEPLAQAATAFGVSERQVRNAGEVMREGTAELVAAVERGEVTLAQAKALAQMTPSKQRSIIAGGKQAILAALRQPSILAEYQEKRRESQAKANGGGNGTSTAAMADALEADKLLRLEANKMLQAVHDWNVKAEQMIEHGYVQYAIRKWPPDRKKEFADECALLRDEMNHWYERLTEKGGEA